MVHGEIYRLTCEPSGKVYIGKTMTVAEKRWKHHVWRATKADMNVKLHNALRKYGSACWKVEKIEAVFADTRKLLNEALSEAEIRQIVLHDSYHNGYNMTIGGDGGAVAPRPPEVGRAISEGKKKAFAKNKVETGDAMSPEWRQAMRDAKLGTTETEEHRAAIGEGNKKAWAEGRRKPKLKKEQPPKKVPGQRMRELWADPVWADNQRKRLAEGAKKRPPRTEESKKKAGDTQRGVPKPRRKQET